MSFLARAGDVEAHHPEADGHQTSAREVFAAFVQTKHENDSRDDPSVTKKAGTPGRDGNHGLNMEVALGRLLNGDEFAVLPAVDDVIDADRLVFAADSSGDRNQLR